MFSNLQSFKTWNCMNEVFLISSYETAEIVGAPPFDPFDLVLSHIIHKIGNFFDVIRRSQAPIFSFQIKIALV